MSLRFYGSSFLIQQIVKSESVLEILNRRINLNDLNLTNCCFTKALSNNILQNLTGLKVSFPVMHITPYGQVKATTRGIRCGLS